MNIEFWFEFGSTYSYPAAMRIEQLAKRKGLNVIWRPFLLGPIFREQDWHDSPFNLYATKGRYMWRDLERICVSHQIDFSRPSVFPRNGLLAARISCAFTGAAWVPAFVRAVYRANFVDDLDIADEAVLAQCLVFAGQQPQPAIDAACTAAAKDRLRAQTVTAQRAGIFGAPSFVVGGELFWGHDRLVDAIAWTHATRA